MSSQTTRETDLIELCFQNIDLRPVEITNLFELAALFQSKQLLLRSALTGHASSQELARLASNMLSQVNCAFGLKLVIFQLKKLVV